MISKMNPHLYGISLPSNASVVDEDLDSDPRNPLLFDVLENGKLFLPSGRIQVGSVFFVAGSRSRIRIKITGSTRELETSFIFL